MYPKILINKKQLVENVQMILSRTKQTGITVTGVTKAIAGNVEMAQAFVDAGITCLGDSRIQNLKKLQDIECEKWLIRIPMLSECEAVVEYTTASLNSEIETIRRLNLAAGRQNKTHGVILMIDVGDLREGIFLGTNEDMCEENKNLAAEGLETVESIVKEVLGMSHIRLRGFGINSTCFGATIPVAKTYEKLLELKTYIEGKYNISCDVISGGNSSCYYLFEKKMMPEGVTNMRLGELLLFGRETSYLEEYSYLHQNNFILETEIVEIKKKPSYPVGLIGVNSFGEKIEFQDKGLRTRVIIALGKQDVLLDHIIPVDRGITVEGGSSDHIMLDVTDSTTEYNVGDIISFHCDYASVLSLCTSEYVETKVL